MLLQTLFYPLPFPSFPQIKNNPYRKIIIPSLPHPTTSPKKEKEKKKPLLSLFSPPFLRSNTIPLLSTHTISEPPIISLQPLFSAYLPIQPASLPSPTIPINSDIPTHTTTQKPSPPNSFVVISLYRILYIG